MEKDDKLLLPTTQKLVELSFLQGNVKLKEVMLIVLFALVKITTTKNNLVVLF